MVLPGLDVLIAKVTAMVPVQPLKISYKATYQLLAMQIFKISYKITYIKNKQYVIDMTCHQVGFNGKYGSNLSIQHSPCSICYKSLLSKLLISRTTFWRHGFKEYTLRPKCKEEDSILSKVKRRTRHF